MEHNRIVEISEIIDSFDIGEIQDMIENQINDEYVSLSSSTSKVDYFKPLHLRYSELFDTDIIMSEDDRAEIKERFMAICKLFLRSICKKFEIELDGEFLANNLANFPSLTFALYSFFILDFESNLTFVLYNYISKNYKDIYNEFSALKNKKDATTISYKKTLPIEYTVIIANIHDIVEWILDQMDTQEYFDLLEPDYLYTNLLSELFRNGSISGNFIDKVSEIVKNDLSLKSNMCFELISLIKRLK